MIGRVVTTIGTWGRAGGYFATEEEAQTFEDELKAILVNQMAAFNSPVWFNVGFEEKPQCSACVPYRGLVSTPDGLVPIGELVDGDQVGREVYDSNGITRIVATKYNGRKRVYRVTLRNGQWIEATADHVVKAVNERRTQPSWLRVDELEPGMRMHLYPHRAKVAEPALVAAGGSSFDDFGLDDDRSRRRGRGRTRRLAPGGRLRRPVRPRHEPVADRRVPGRDRRGVSAGSSKISRSRSATCTGMSATFRHRIRRFTSAVMRLYGEHLREFVERWGLLARGTEIRVPSQLWTASQRRDHPPISGASSRRDGYVTGSPRQRVRDGPHRLRRDRREVDRGRPTAPERSRHLLAAPPEGGEASGPSRPPRDLRSASARSALASPR